MTSSERDRETANVPDNWLPDHLESEWRSHMYPDFFVRKMAEERQRHIRETAQSCVLDDAICSAARLLPALRHLIFRAVQSNAKKQAIDSALTNEMHRRSIDVP
jgi:hypothetical protein